MVRVVAMTGEGANVSMTRLATLARAAGGADAAVRELVAQAFEIVVHVSRTSDGSIRVMSIEEVIGFADNSFDTHVLFQYQNGSVHADRDGAAVLRRARGTRDPG